MDGCETPRSIWSRNARNIMVGEVDLCKPCCRPCKSNAVGSPGNLPLVSRPYRELVKDPCTRSDKLASVLC